MAYLYTATSGNLTRASFSGWVKVPAESQSISFRLFEFGDVNTGFGSGIGYGAFFFTSFPDGSIAGSAVLSGPGGTSSGVPYLPSLSVNISNTPANPIIDNAGTDWILAQMSISSSGTQFIGGINTGRGNASGAFNLISQSNVSGSALAQFASFAEQLNDVGAANPIICTATPQSGFPFMPPPPPLVETPKLEFGPIYLWLGQYIDFTVASNCLQFVNIGPAVVTPTQSSAVFAAFGTPAFHFEGGSAQFSNNQGNSGTMSKVGTISNYSPAPSFTGAAGA